MEPGQVNVYKRIFGHFQQASNTEVDGLQLLLTLCNTPLSSKVRYGRFTRASISSSGTKLVTGDHFGGVYYFSLGNNTFRFVSQLKSCCTAIAVSDSGKGDILVGTTSGSFICFTAEDSSKVVEFNDHESSIFRISVDGSNARALVCSEEVAIVYCLESHLKLRCLKNIKRICLLEAFFQPVTDNIISLYRDGLIYIWDSTTWECLHELSAGNDANIYLRSLDASVDGFYLAGGGSAKVLQVWHLSDPTLSYMHPFHMNIKQVAFMPLLDDATKHHLAILGCNGSLFVFNIEEKAIVYLVEASQDMMTMISFPAKTVNMVCVTANGYVNYFDLETLYDKMGEKPSRTSPDVQLKITEKPSPLPPTPVAESVPEKDYIAILKSLENFDDLAMNQLQNILRQYGEYPRKYRYLIWKKLLKLPDNSEAFSVLMKRAAVEHLDTFPPFPVLDKKIGNTFKTILSCLALWYPRLQLVDYLPLFAYPFVKLFYSEPRTCFEIIATLINSLWHQKWFQHGSIPPTHVLKAVEDLLELHAPDLMAHYKNNLVGSEVFGWTLLKSAFSEVFIRDDWLKIWDNILSNPPSFIICVVTSFNIVSKECIMSLSTSDIKRFFETQNNVPASKVVESSYRIINDESSHNVLKTFTPHIHALTKGIYPKLTDPPSKSVQFPCSETQPISLDDSASYKSGNIPTTPKAKDDVESSKLVFSPVVNEILSRTHDFHNETSKDPMKLIREVLQMRIRLASEHSYV